MTKKKKKVVKLLKPTIKILALGTRNIFATKGVPIKLCGLKIGGIRFGVRFRFFWDFEKCSNSLNEVNKSRNVFLHV